MSFTYHIVHNTTSFTISHRSHAISITYHIHHVPYRSRRSRTLQFIQYRSTHLSHTVSLTTRFSQAPYWSKSTPVTSQSHQSLVNISHPNVRSLNLRSRLHPTPTYLVESITLLSASRLAFSVSNPSCRPLMSSSPSPALDHRPTSRGSNLTGGTTNLRNGRMKRKMNTMLPDATARDTTAGDATSCTNVRTAVGCCKRAC